MGLRPFAEVRLEKVMTRRPATIEEGAPLEDAAAMMTEGGFRHLPVVDGAGRITGMLSERDLRVRLGTDVERFVDATPDALSQTVASAMTPEPIALGPRATLAQALEVFADERVGAIPVVDEGDRVVGIASYLDLLGYLRVREGTEAAAAGPGRPARPAAAPGEPPAARPRRKEKRPSRRATRAARGAVRRRARRGRGR
jgi:CBS domain-containing protein